MNVRDGVSTTSSGLLAALAVPDTDGLSLDGVLAAESAGVLGVLGGFHLLDHLPQRGTISVIQRLVLCSKQPYDPLCVVVLMCDAA